MSTISLTTAPQANSSSKPGNGFFLDAAAGIGTRLMSIDGTLYKKESDTLELILTPQPEKTLLTAMISWQLFAGYTYLLDNNITVGLEVSLLSPGPRIGYMIQDNMQLSVGTHYNFFFDPMFKDATTLTTTNRDEKTEVINTPTFSALSGFGASIVYEYFTPSKLTYRVDLRATYLRADNVLMVTKPSAKATSFLPYSANGNLSVWDISLSFGVGQQW